jgi:hypothetical protein
MCLHWKVRLPHVTALKREIDGELQLLASCRLRREQGHHL